MNLSKLVKVWEKLDRHADKCDDPWRSSEANKIASDLLEAIGLSEEQAKAVIKHELMHSLFEHERARKG